MSVNHIPDGYHTATPYLAVNGAAKALEFYKNAFGSTELFRLVDENGKIGHAEIQIGDSRIMLADESPEIGFLAPGADGRSIGLIMLYVPDVDAMFERALSQGARQTREVKDQFYGDRSGTLVDPFGHKWTIATHIEDVSPEEMDRRIKEAMGASA